tara:strand:- start:11932 stop:12807 length:876 start_codon:yes stop_codon:yes gene_type:complete
MLRTIDSLIIVLLIVLILCKCSGLEFFESNNNSYSKNDVISSLSDMCKNQNDTGPVCQHLNKLNNSISTATNGHVKGMFSDVIKAAKDAGKISAATAQKAIAHVDVVTDKISDKIGDMSKDEIRTSNPDIIAAKAKAAANIKKKNMHELEEKTDDMKENLTKSVANTVAELAKKKEIMTTAASKNDMAAVEKAAKAAVEKLTEHITPIHLEAPPPTKKITAAVVTAAKEAIDAAHEINPVNAVAPDSAPDVKKAKVAAKIVKIAPLAIKEKQSAVKNTFNSIGSFVTSHHF